MFNCRALLSREQNIFENISSFPEYILLCELLKGFTDGSIVRAESRDVLGMSELLQGSLFIIDNCLDLSGWGIRCDSFFSKSMAKEGELSD